MAVVGEDWRRFPPIELDAPLAAALAAFLEVGYHGATIRDIAQRAGLSVPGLYHHYASKQEMLVAILDLTMDDLQTRMLAARAEGADPVARFALLVECLALFHTHRRELGFVGASEMRSRDPFVRGPGRVVHHAACPRGLARGGDHVHRAVPVVPGRRTVQPRGGRPPVRRPCARPGGQPSLERYAPGGEGGGCRVEVLAGVPLKPPDVGRADR